MLKAKVNRYVLLAVWIMATAAAMQAQTELSAREIAAKALPSVVLLICDAGNDISLGSGFFIRPGVLVTNYHVIEGMSRGLVQVAVGSRGEKRTFRVARVIAFDKASDIALLSVPAAKDAGVSTLSLAPSTYKIEVGENVYALGNPEGLIGTMSPGIVSAGLRSTLKETRIQITAPISHGSSGGPVVNGAGTVIGVAVSSLSEGQNLNFAVPVSLAYAVVGNAQFPDARQNALDTSSDSNAILRPWGLPLVKGSGNAGGAGNGAEAGGTAKTASDYFYSGNSNYDSRRYPEAIAEHTKAIQFNPQFAAAYINRGNAYAGQENYGLAIADYSKAIQIDPQYASAYYNRGAAYVKQENYGLGIADYSKAIQIDPQNVNAYNNRGAAYEGQENDGLAIADYSKAIQIDPQYASAYYNRGLHT